jgi:lipid A disaccharide synthetase
VKDEFLITNKRYFSSDMETAIRQIRTQFRHANKIDENAHAVFIAPGNEKNEVEFCMENLRKGVKEFLLKYSAPTSLAHKALPLDGNFVTVLSLHEGSEGEKWVREYLEANEWTGRVVIVTNENNQHLDAMAACDYGLIHDGQMVSSANALNLPVSTVFHMRMNQ